MSVTAIVFPRSCLLVAMTAEEVDAENDQLLRPPVSRQTTSEIGLDDFVGYRYKRNEDSMLMFGANHKIVEAQAARKKEELYFSAI
ncbi:hypothetical protein PHAVU_010G150600 [Phaseolus vulgaris]|uniref:Uncharacterized protein n=1 Tax=Phaseolus vulgaris TaxID=3885 RepID=V7AQX3_PHAVU|nr:hypothetical protein PHAVU_010G150600g [Phaseolus vulgaris]XP_007135696.1 hypothetical protein PHAVU_010G150600g [Phaseolus vulgaris]ESW07689.1 hypothetical protein PHAVU_010G150600g [Phaseolus vulgaris]ESW07690.1 hypothetical protein PHAVU_010G150600g [Phaseolus vulgaris]